MLPASRTLQQRVSARSSQDSWKDESEREARLLSRIEQIDVEMQTWKETVDEPHEEKHLKRRRGDRRREAAQEIQEKEELLGKDKLYMLELNKLQLEMEELQDIHKEDMREKEKELLLVTSLAEHYNSINQALGAMQEF